MESATSTGTGASRSHRSSFAVERLSLDGSGQAPGANEAPQPALSQQHLEAMCLQLGIPKPLCNRYVLSLRYFYAGFHFYIMFDQDMSDHHCSDMRYVWVTLY